MIYLDDKYRVVGIPNNFVLEYKTERKTSDSTGDDWSVCGYYQQLSNLMKSYIDIKVKDLIGGHNIETNFEFVLTKIEEIKKILEEKLNYNKEK